DVRGAVSATAQVLVDHRCHARGSEVAALAGAGREQRVLEQWPQVRPQPLADRHAKAHYRTRQDLGWQAVAHDLTPEPLRGSAAQIVARRKRRAELDQPMVE